MMTNDEINDLWDSYMSRYEITRSIESVVQAPLLARIAELEANELKLHKILADSVLHAKQGWERYNNANRLSMGLQAKLAQVAQDAQPVAVYQYQLANGHWTDQTKGSYDYNVRHGQATVRALYTSPLKQVPLTQREKHRLWNTATYNNLSSTTDAAMDFGSAIESAHGIDTAAPVKTGEQQ